MENNEFQNIKNNNLSIIYTNADSLANKLKDLEILINSFSEKPKIIAVTEIKSKILTSGLQLAEFNLKGYNIISNDLDINSRGIILYIDKNIEFSIIENSIAFREYVLIKIKLIDKTELLVCVVYRSPNSSDDNNKLMFDLLRYINKFNKDKFIIIGGF